jgi:hypothetical protein
VIFTRNKLDKNNDTLLNKLIVFGGNIKYSNGLYIWNNKTYADVKSMEKHWEKMR